MIKPDVKVLLYFVVAVKKRKTPNSTTRTMWSKNDKKEPQILFQDHFHTGKCPTQGDCQTAINNSKKGQWFYLQKAKR